MMESLFRFPWWPISPVFTAGVFTWLLIIAGVIFSIVMLIDCLKRPPSKFPHQLTKNGEYDKLIWAIAILVSFGIYFVGPIVYFFVVKRAEQQGNQQQQ